MTFSDALDNASAKVDPNPALAVPSLSVHETFTEHLEIMKRMTLLIANCLYKLRTNSSG